MVEISIDGGATWNVIYASDPVEVGEDFWANGIDISDYVGIQFTLHLDIMILLAMAKRGLLMIFVYGVMREILPIQILIQICVGHLIFTMYTWMVPYRNRRFFRVHSRKP